MLLIQLSFTDICFPIPSATLEISAFPPVLRPRFPVKVTGTKSGKKVSKNLAANITVKNPAVRIKIDGKTVKKPTVVVGEKVTLTGVSAPKSSAITFRSSDETVATVDADGTLTPLKAGTVNIAAKNSLGVKYVINVTVKDAVAELSAITQTASNAFTATFTSDASKTITKDDFKVAAADGSVELAVKEVAYSADGLSAKVTLFNSFTDTTAYKITCKEKVFDLTAKVGAVVRVVINTASAEQNVETPIGFTLFDADNIDVTPSINLDTTCFVSATGSYSALNTDRASKASITMNTIGDKAEVTVVYNSNQAGAEDITATGTIVCTDPKAVQGSKLFAATTDINKKSDCAKFYLGLSDTTVTVAVGSPAKDVYFCAKDNNGDVISYDSYEVESSNDDRVSASLEADSGKYAKLSVTGNSVGSASLNVKATKNGKDTYYSIPVSVTSVAEAVSMTVSVSRPTMSNVVDDDYFGIVNAQLYDKNKNKVNGDFTYEIINNVTTGVTTGAGFTVDDNGKYSAAGATAKTYTIKVTGADRNTGKTFVRNVNVTVKALPETTTNLKLTYQIELDKTVIDENPIGGTGSTVTAKLYATYNGLFAGYVRQGASGVEIAKNGYVTPSDKLSDVDVAAKFGTDKFTGDLFTKVNDYASLGTTAGITFNAVNAVSGSSIKWTPEGSEDLARTGLYTIEYRLTINGKVTSRTQTFTVKNSVVIPTVTVLSRTVNDLNNDTIIANLKTNVDMNNNTSEHDSIIKLAKDKDGNPAVENGGKMTVKYAVVVDNYSNGDWEFYIPINATFKTE